MEIDKMIHQKIMEKSRKDIIYVHPVMSINEVCKYISAFSNTNGGIIAFGVRDDGRNLKVLKSAFNMTGRKKEIEGMFEDDIDIEFGSYVEEQNHKIEYIYVRKMKDMVYFDKKAYIINLESNHADEIVCKKIFISYCQKDACLADIAEKTIIDKVKNVIISRDIRMIGYKDSISKFMQSIVHHDYIIQIISDNYLKSRNCMYEMVEMLRDREYFDKLLYIVVSDGDSKYYSQKVGEKVGAKVYDIFGQAEYINYWKDYENKIQIEIDKLNDSSVTKNLVDELQVVKKIESNIQEFMTQLRDRMGTDFGKQLENGFDDIIKFLL